MGGPRKRIWLAVAIALLTLGSSAGAFFAYDPLWVVDRGVDTYLRGRGVESKWVTVDGNAIHYLEAQAKLSDGPADKAAARPLVLVHGLGAKAADWNQMLPDLAAHGYHVYALDLLGYGDSAKPAGGDYTIRGEEKIVIDFMKQVGIANADVAGWSMGGWVATEMALDRPELVHKLLLYDSAGMYFVVRFPLSLFTPRDKQGLEDLTAMIEPNVPHMRIPDFAVPGMLRRFSKSEHIVNASFNSMLTGRDMLDFRVHRLKMPVLMVWGTEDKLTPFELAQRMHAEVPQSVLIGIKGCGHLAAAECSRQVLPATEQFLDADPPQRGYEQILDSGWPGKSTATESLAAKL